MLKIIKLVLMIFFIVSFNTKSQSQETKVVDQIIAVVGNKMILESSVQNQVLQYRAQGYNLDKDMRCQVFEELLYQKLLVNQAAIDSVEVTEKEINQSVEARIEQFLQQSGGDVTKIEEYFGKSILDIKDEFKDVFEEQLLVQEMQRKIAGDVKITPSDVRNFFNDIPKDSLPTIQEEFEYAQITKLPPVTKDMKEATKKRLNELHERIKSGEKFATLAVLYSEDPGSAKKGGDLGFVNRADLVTEFASVAFSLRENEISNIVETEFGFHIIQMVERKGEQVRVRHILLKPQTTAETKIQAKKLLDSVSVMIRLDTLSFAQAALKFSDDVNSKNNGGLMGNPYTGTSKFEKKHIDPATIYVLQGLKLGEISEPFEAQDERGGSLYKIIMLRKKTPAHPINIKDDYQHLRDMATEDKKMKIVDEWVKKKQKTTYIRIVDEYKTCPFRFDGWLN